MRKVSPEERDRLLAEIDVQANRRMGCQPHFKASGECSPACEACYPPEATFQNRPSVPVPDALSHAERISLLENQLAVHTDEIQRLASTLHALATETGVKL